MGLEETRALAQQSNDRVPGGQCICVHDGRPCSEAPSPEPTAERVGLDMWRSRVQELYNVNRDNNWSMTRI